MAGDTVRQIKDRLSIADVVSQYAKLERSGSSLRARCPFHAEKTPSFFVSVERGTYHCFGCGAGGDIFSFVEAIEGLDFKGALKVLAEKAGIEIAYERGGREKKDERDRLFELLEAAAIFYASRLDDSVEKYLHERGIHDEIVKAFRLGLSGDAWSEASGYLKSKKFTDKELLDAGIAKKNERGGLTDKFRNRIMFPIADPAGRIVGFSGRIFGGHASPDAPKYLNSPETPLFRKSRILYGFDRAKGAMRRHRCAVLVEGQMDLLASHQAGWGNAVAVSGTAFTPEHAQLIKRMTDNLVIALDADEAGLKAAGRAAREALRADLEVKVAQLPEGRDPADLIGGEKGPETWTKTIRDSKDIVVFLLDVLQARAKDAGRFRRAVESAVLPFLADVRSPIARDHYVRQIAERIGISYAAVNEALMKQPRMPEGADSADAVSQSASAPLRDAKRPREAYALLLWQQSLQNPAIDPAEFERASRDAMGEETFSGLAALAETEKESLRFEAERVFGKALSLSREAAALVRVMLEERLKSELSEAIAALRAAERSGDEREVIHRMDVCNLLTTKIAQLHEKG